MWGYNQAFFSETQAQTWTHTDVSVKPFRHDPNNPLIKFCDKKDVGKGNISGDNLSKSLWPPPQKRYLLK